MITLATATLNNIQKTPGEQEELRKKQAFGAGLCQNLFDKKDSVLATKNQLTRPKHYFYQNQGTPIINALTKG